MKWLWLVVVGALAVVGAAVLVLSRATAAELGRLRADVSRVEGETSRIERAAARRRVVVERVSAGSEPGTSAAESEIEGTNPGAEGIASTSARDESDLTHEERDHRLKVINETRRDLCEKTYAAEPRDPEWSAKATQSLRESYGTEQFKSLRLSVDCRSTLCRVDFSYEDPTLALGAIQSLFATSPWSGTRFSHYDQETRKGSSYVAREGFELPAVDEKALKY
jgi:hypothetical protein